MCGRFAQTKELTLLISRFRFIAEDFEIRRRYNIAPGQDAAVLVLQGGERRLKMMRWGIIPSWTKPDSSAKPFINARAETLAEKPSFKYALAQRRCLIPADGFYEWRKEPAGRLKTPFFFALKNGEPFAFAGLWDELTPPEGSPLKTFTIITTTANDLVRSIHERMPVILPMKNEARWLDPDLKKPERLLSLLTPYPAEEMTLWRVSPLVNSPQNDSPECLRAVRDTQGFLS